MTNSTCSNWWDEKPEGIGIPTKCYASFSQSAAFAPSVWVRGCAYDAADPLSKRFADKLISENQKGDSK